LGLAHSQTPQERDLQNISYEDLFKAAFKKEFERPHYFVVNFIADGKDFGNTEIFYDSAFTAFTFYSVPFSKYLDEVLLPEERLKISDLNGNFNSNQLKDLGFEVNLDENGFALQISLPPEIKELQRLNLSRTAEPRGTLIEPAFFSLYSNFYAYDSFYCGDLPGDCLRTPVLLTAEGAAAMGGFVLEGSAYFDEPNSSGETWKNNIRRGDLRLVKDIYSKDMRLTFGDVNEVGGIRLEHSERIFNRDRTEPHKINFFLQKASYVEIYIDGQLSRRLYLPSGHHEISGFAGHSGVNSIQVFVPRPDGSLQQIRYEFELGEGVPLRKGESRHYLNAGIQRTSVPYPTSYKYHPSEPGLNAEYAYGLLHNTSIGFSWLVSRQNLHTGFQLQNANPLGYTEILGSISYSDNLPYMGARGEVRNYSSFEALPNANFSLAGYFQNPTYNPSLFLSRGSGAGEYAGIYGTFNISFVSLNAGVYFNDNMPSPIDYRYGISVSQSIFGLSLNAAMSSIFNEKASSYHLSLNVGYNFGVNNHYITISNDLTRRSSSIEPELVENPYYSQDPYDDAHYYEPKYIRIPGYSAHSWSRRTNLGWSWADGSSSAIGQSYYANVAARGNTIESPKSDIDASLNAFYYLNRAEMGANYNFARYESRSGYAQRHSASATASTSFMFADGLWAFGRPVRGGFILADADKSLKGSIVRINYSELYDSDMSHSDFFGSAYKNNLTSYYNNSINIRLNNMPEGAYLEENNYYATGAYKQGYALRLGNDMRVFMQVRLISEEGELSNIYVAISQISSDGKAVDKRSTFTSRSGVLQMGNLIPGEKYRISFDPSTSIKDIDIEIPKDSEPFLDLPDVKVRYEN